MKTSLFSGITYCEPSKIEVEIMNIESPNRVWIRLTQNWAHFHSRLQMSTLCELDEDLSVGDLVLFRRGSLVCRGEIEECLDEECSVRLMDHGRVETVTRSMLSHIKDHQLLDVPSFCFPIRVHGVEPAGTHSDQWTIESVMCLKKLVKGKKVVMKKMEEDSAELWVEETSRDNPVGPERRVWKSVAKHLELEGVALRAGIREYIKGLFPYFLH